MKRVLSRFLLFFLYMQRVITYIDGFNLYFGLKSKGWRRYYWLDMCRLSQNILQSHQQLVTTKYFTSRITSPPAKRKRQSDYLEALDTLNNLTIYYGHYQHSPYSCRQCGHAQTVPHEKMTDVNIAVELLTDASQDAFDTALLITADSDLVGPIITIKRLYPTKRVVVCLQTKFGGGHDLLGWLYNSRAHDAFTSVIVANKMCRFRGYLGK